MQDEDTDVRIRACKLIESLWLLYVHEKQQNKRDQQVYDHLFTHIKAGELLAEAVSGSMNRICLSVSILIFERRLWTRIEWFA